MADATHTQEIWLPVAGYEGLYEVSSIGRVRSLDRRVNSKNGSTALKNGRVLKQHISKRTQYLGVSLSRSDVKATKNVHSLVCEAFHGPRPFPGAQVAHQDGSRDNNQAANLRWDDAKGNAADRRLHGTAPVGECAGNSRLRAEAVLAIRARYTGARGELSELGREFGISKQQVGHIVRRTQWAHI